MNKPNDSKAKRETFRSLENYKAQQMEVAKNKGREAQLKAATTLTSARKIVYGR